MIDQLEKEIHEGMLDLYQHQSMSKERESLVYFYFAGIHNENITLKEEIERLKDLCNKYEEEHKTAFEEWKKAINIINELEKWVVESIEKYTEDYLDWKYDRNVYLAGNKKLQNVLDKLQELKGSGKE